MDLHWIFPASIGLAYWCYGLALCPPGGQQDRPTLVLPLVAMPGHDISDYSSHGIAMAVTQATGHRYGCDSSHSHGIAMAVTQANSSSGHDL